MSRCSQNEADGSVAWSPRSRNEKFGHAPHSGRSLTLSAYMRSGAAPVHWDVSQGRSRRGGQRHHSASSSARVLQRRLVSRLGLRCGWGACSPEPDKPHDVPCTTPVCHPQVHPRYSNTWTSSCKIVPENRLSTKVFQRCPWELCLVVVGLRGRGYLDSVQKLWR